MSALGQKRTLLPLEDAIDVVRRTAKQISLINPIRNQATFLNRERVRIDRRETPGQSTAVIAFAAVAMLFSFAILVALALNA
jgi:hypothetical protein